VELVVEVAQEQLAIMDHHQELVVMAVLDPPLQLLVLL
jgi:hypothetical protein